METLLLCVLVWHHSMMTSSCLIQAVIALNMLKQQYFIDKPCLLGNYNGTNGSGLRGCILTQTRFLKEL
jgi:hypothetical protein